MMTYAIFAAITFVAAAIFVWKDNLIPNGLLLVMLGLFAADYIAFWDQGASMTIKLPVTLFVFVLGFVLFLKKKIGAGLAKLLPVITIWLPPVIYPLFFAALAIILWLRWNVHTVQSVYILDRSSSLLLVCSAVFVLGHGYFA